MSKAMTRYTGSQLEKYKELCPIDYSLKTRLAWARQLAKIDAIVEAKKNKLRKGKTC
jgi:hypothetical protein